MGLLAWVDRGMRRSHPVRRWKPTPRTLGMEVLEERRVLAVNISVAGFSVAEGHGTVDVYVALSEPAPAPVTFSYYTSDGSAESGSDFTATIKTLTIPQGETYIGAPVPIIDDTEPEPDETFHVTLFNVTGRHRRADGDNDDPRQRFGGSRNPLDHAQLLL